MYPHIHLGPSLQISTYFLIISIATIVGSLWFLKRAKDLNLNLTTAIDLALVGLIAGFVGARVLHVLYESPVFYREDWRRIFYVWNGGFVFFGGMIATFFASEVFCSLKREPFWLWADRAAPPLALGYALGRTACFFNGCCFGKHCDLAWAVYMHGAYRHPTQLYATLLELVTLGVLLWAEPKLKTNGMLFNLWLVLHALGRITMELFRDDARGHLIMGLSLGTFISVLLAGFGFLNLFLNRARR